MPFHIKHTPRIPITLSLMIVVILRVLHVFVQITLVHPLYIQIEQIAAQVVSVFRAYLGRRCHVLLQSVVAADVLH